MGWDGVEFKKDFTNKEIKKYLDDWYSPIDSAIINGTYYAAVSYRGNKRSKKVISGLVVLIQIEKKEKILMTKEIPEDMGPAESDCPTRIIKLLSPTKNRIALRWRQECLDNDNYNSIPTIFFGNYYQTSKRKMTPIEWLILKKDKKNNKTLLLSKFILDCKCFDDTMHKVGDEEYYNIENNKNRKKSEWELSSIRSWLNEDFYNKAFSQSEKRKICSTELKADNKKSKDKIFLLSADEIKKYSKVKFLTSSMLLCEGTNFAKSVKNYSRRLFVNPAGYSNYWLRSSSRNYKDNIQMDDWNRISLSSIIYCVVPGYVQEKRNKWDGGMGVRPAIWVK